jgi:DNA-binding transcriptional LysR family regulator
VDVASGLHFSHTVMAIAAALDDQGVALAPHIFVAEELADGRLVAVDAKPCVTGIGLYLVWSAARAASLSPAAVLFRDWLLAEARREDTAVLRLPRRRSSAAAGSSPVS